jgi:prepilin-type N-terminal cleavage/methylation domain-containing protein
MYKKGFTLVEVIIAIALLGMIAVAILPLITFGFVNLKDSKKFTIDTFSVQQQVEEEMEIMRNKEIAPGDPSFEIEVFGKAIEGHLVNFDIKSATGTAHGNYKVFVPKYKVVYTVPVIQSVSLNLYKNGTAVSPIPNTIDPLDNTLELRGTKIDGSQEEFLMNVYQWYISPVADTPPTDIREYSILKEWNAAKKPLSYSDSENFSFIPNIKANYDKLKFSEFDLTNEEIIERFDGRYVVYSVTPYSTIGRVGVEKFSNPIQVK